MSPPPPRYPSPASGDDAAPGGRHRRPESLADVTPPRRGVGAPSVRPHRHEPAGLDADHVVGLRQAHPHPADERPPATQTRRTARPGRHTAVGRRAAVRPPVMGSHRAPGTLPIESWLLLGGKRQQALLASLVAVALALVAIPSGRGAWTR